MGDHAAAMTVVQEPYGRLRLAERFVISEFNDGINVDSRIVDHLITVLHSHYGDRPFAYISNRIHDYSVDLLEVRRCIAALPLVAIALVAPMTSVIMLELGFYQRPIQAFTSLDEAIAWVGEQMH